MPPFGLYASYLWAGLQDHGTMHEAPWILAIGEFSQTHLISATAVSQDSGLEIAMNLVSTQVIPLTIA